MDFWSEFHGPNAGYIVECYERYRHDPASIDAEMRAFFDGLAPEYIEALQCEIPVRLDQIEADNPFKLVPAWMLKKLRV
jgi:2-oxoglutarate dehydrogenase E1 component